MPADGLDLFLPPVREWFRAAFASPTDAQSRGWPAIHAGRNTLILAPTGSGKTLAAFLAALDLLWREPERRRGIGIVYVSPLKALNQDVARNLEWPLLGIREAAARAGQVLRPLTVAVRTGDTPSSERQRLIRSPPDILITTPESLHVLLAGRARGHFAATSHVIVDEIHAVCSNKRGVFLAILLERLERLAQRNLVRIGLSATQRPLDRVARFLGGVQADRAIASPDAVSRPVTIIDAGSLKALDLSVAFPTPLVTADGAQATIWPAIEARLIDLVNSHDSTIIFANNRRVVERLTARLNGLDELRVDGREAVVPESSSSDKTSDDHSFAIVSHHGSLSLARRRETETALKDGRIRAVVATASLELGIDMGAVDLVCQVESPGQVSRGLQRVGRAGHMVGGSSKGRLFAKNRGDLMESAALARAMRRGEVEHLRVPTLCLDLLAQQIIACVAVEAWDARELFDLFRRADPYRDLSMAAFEAVLAMVSGRLGLDAYRDVRARISWDRIHNRLEALPGTASLALTGGGAIGDTGQFAVHLGDGGPRLGELDEEFVLERRIGDAFTLGTAAWRIDAIDADRVVVSPAERADALLPFWRGEAGSRSAELGVAIGELVRAVGERLDDPGLLDWLVTEYFLEHEAARAVRRHVARQHEAAGVAPDDRTILVDAFRDPAGDWLVAILSPRGARFHQGLKIVLLDRIAERYGLSPAAVHADDGLLLRFPGVDEPPINLLDDLTASEAEARLRRALPMSAAFGLRFRQNAARALLMPRPRPGKRTPLWLQRLRAKDLLEVARRVPDFPIVTESLRECLVDDFELDRFREQIGQIESGGIRIATRIGEAPSPFAAELLLPFTTKFLYEWDEPRAAAKPADAAPQALLDTLLDPARASSMLSTDEGREAVRRLDARLRGRLHAPRSATEAVEWVRALGDVSPSEIDDLARPLLASAEEDGRLSRLELAGVDEPDRWVTTEDAERYRLAFEGGHPGPREGIVRHYLRTRALVALDEVLARYPLGRGEALDLLERWTAAGEVVALADGPESPRWADPRNLAITGRTARAARRRAAVAVGPEVFAWLVGERQGLVGPRAAADASGVLDALDRLRGRRLPVALWESEVLPARVDAFRPELLDQALAVGGLRWAAEGAGDDRTAAFFDREFPVRGQAEELELAEGPARWMYDRLRNGGARYASELAADLGLSHSEARAVLEELTSLGVVTNDLFGPLRCRSANNPDRVPRAADARGRLGRPRRNAVVESMVEGRWSAVDAGAIDTETRLAEWAAALLGRYGVLTRELMALERGAPHWRELAGWLERAEWREEVRRGYFVEGLSGLQYADREAVERLQVLARTEPRLDHLRLIASLDPANLYGSGAPFDVPTEADSPFRLIRSDTSHVVLLGGRPILAVEGSGRRIGWPVSAAALEVDAALALLPTLASPSRRVVKIESINGLPAWTHPAASRLDELGFRRDPPALTFYLGW